MTGTDASMYYKPGTPGTPGYGMSGTLPGSPVFPDSTMKTFRQGMGANVSLSTWGSDFTPTMYGGGHTYSPVSICYHCNGPIVGSLVVS